MTQLDDLTSDLFCSLLLHCLAPVCAMLPALDFLLPLIIHAAGAENYPRNLGLSPGTASGMLRAVELFHR